MYYTQSIKVHLAPCARITKIRSLLLFENWSHENLTVVFGQINCTVTALNKGILKQTKRFPFFLQFYIMMIRSKVHSESILQRLQRLYYYISYTQQTQIL